MLNSLRYSKPYHRPGIKETSHQLKNEERNRTIILLMLNQGMQASELCNLNIHHVDLKARYIRVMGKDITQTVWLGLEVLQPDELLIEEIAKLNDRYTNIYG